jgi:hypothetical protein
VSDGTFGGFIVLRLVIPGTLSLALQFAALSTFRYRSAEGRKWRSATSTSNTSASNDLDKEWNSSKLEL